MMCHDTRGVLPHTVSCHHTTLCDGCTPRHVTTVDTVVLFFFIPRTSGHVTSLRPGGCRCLPGVLCPGPGLPSATGVGATGLPMQDASGTSSPFCALCAGARVGKPWQYDRYSHAGRRSRTDLTCDVLAAGQGSYNEAASSSGGDTGGGQRGRMRSKQRARRVTTLPARWATGGQWRDDKGQSLAWLEHMGFTEQAASVRAAYSSGQRNKCAVLMSARQSSVEVGDDGTPPTSASLLTDCSQSEYRTPDQERPQSPEYDPGTDTGMDMGMDTSIGPPSDQDYPTGGFDGNLLRQPLMMSYDAVTRQMTLPIEGSRQYGGYVVSLVSATASEGERRFECWFDDHTTEEVPESTLRQCVVRPRDMDRDTVSPLTPEAMHVVAATKHAFGHCVMPPCVRDILDGSSRSSAHLLFDSRQVALNQHSTAEVVDDHSPAIVQIILAPGAHDPDTVVGTVCSKCHSDVDLRTCVLSAPLRGRPQQLAACNHVVALRHLWRTVYRCPDTPDDKVDSDIASCSRRERHGPAPRGLSDAEERRDEDSSTSESDTAASDGFPRLLPTSTACHFLLGQVHVYCVLTREHTVVATMPREAGIVACCNDMCAVTGERMLSDAGSTRQRRRPRGHHLSLDALPFLPPHTGLWSRGDCSNPHGATSLCPCT